MAEPGTLEELAAKTPATRDRYVDFLRSASIVTVFVGHWFIGIIWWQHGVIRTTSAIGVTSWMWLGTWIFQVMPIFFFVGGFSNLVTYDSYKRRGESTWAFIKNRIVRLLKPSLVFLAVWTVVQVFLHIADIGRGTGFRIGDTWFLRGMLPPAATVPFGPLWFLGVYFVEVAISPLTIRLHRRFGILVPIALAIGTIVVDVVGFGLGHSGVRYANVAFVLLFPHQLGHFYADGSLTRLPKRVFVAMATLDWRRSSCSPTRRSSSSSAATPGSGGSRLSATTRRASSGPTPNRSRTPTRQPCATWRWGSGPSDS